MATIKQLPDKRRNAPKGPPAVERAIGTNKTQIIGDESGEGLALLSAEYHEQYLPANSAERALVGTLINNEWSLRRLRRAEIEIWDRVSDKILAEKGPTGAITAGETFATASNQFVRHQRAVDSCERNYRRALKELQRLRSPSLKSGTSGRRGLVLQFPKRPHTEPPSSQ